MSTQHLPDQSDPAQSVFGFAYTVTISNTGDVPAQLISRHWLIDDAQGRREEVKGLGVVGQQPLLRPGESFQYTSGCRLRTASGSMRGSYFFVAEDGERFDARSRCSCWRHTPAPTRPRGCCTEQRATRPHRLSRP
jgi:ApaG protein